MKKNLLTASVLGLLAGLAPGAHAQDDTAQTQAKVLPKVQVTANTSGGYATQAQYHTEKADLGPLGSQSIKDSAYSITVVPEQLIVNQQAQTVNDILRDLPSVQIRDQQGLEVSRPQSRGFQGTIVQNTRMDGLNVIGTTAIPAENLSGIEVLNGMAGSLYGPQTPAGVFNYLLKRPTDEPLLRFVESYDSRSIFTEQIDAGGRIGDDGKLGYRFNIVHGEGEDYVAGSNANRTLFSGALDYHIDDRTVIETNFSHYETSADGLPGSIVYDGIASKSGTSSRLPAAPNPTTVGLGQPGAGTDLITNTGLVKLKHDFGNGWTFEAGGLYQDAKRNLFGITNTLTDDRGDYNVTKNFAAVPRFTITSNLAQLNGHFELFGMENDLSIGTNGFSNGQFNYLNSIMVKYPGTYNLSNPAILPSKPTPYNGGQYKAGTLTAQSFIVGDTWHFNDQWSAQAVFSDSYIDGKSYGTKGQLTSSESARGVVSPTVSVIYQPTQRLTTYVSYANSIEPSDQAPANAVNSSAFLSPYHDEQYEAGAKYAVSDDLLLTAAAFRMTRPYAATNPLSGVFSVVGEQKDTGAEFFAQGNLTPEISLLGGITYLNARVLNTGLPTTSGKLVVGVPHVKSDISVDYHPLAIQGFALTGTVHFESRRAATDTNNSFAPSYATLDLGARYTTRAFSHPATVRLQVINLTDKYYYSSIADGSIVGSPGANTAYLGAPRTLMASLELDL